VQLFVIPAVIVAVVIMVWLLFGKLAGGERDAGDYVETIRSGNEKRRWRAAYELASLIGNDKRLAQDPKLLGNLTDLLNQELRQGADTQLKVYLAVALGAFQTLEAESPNGQAIDPLVALERALDPKQPTEVRRAAAESLAKQAARLQGALENPDVVAALAHASSDPEPELRKRATFALGFFGGNGPVEPLRQRLSDDNREVRYNAALALGRRGDLAALDTFRDMLTTTDLARTIDVPNQKEQQSLIETIQLNALRALEMAIRANQPILAQLLRKEVADLAEHSRFAGVRLEAEAVLKSLPSQNPPAQAAKPSQSAIRPAFILA
jgi:HEAT repeat protein